MKTRGSTFQRLIIGLVALAVILSCSFNQILQFTEPSDPQQGAPASAGDPDPNPKPGNDQMASPPVQAGPESRIETQADSQGQSDPEQEPTSEWKGPSGPAVELVWFEESDCAFPDLPSTGASYGPGVLRCQYIWSGKYIDDNIAVIEIDEVPDSIELAGLFEEGMRNTHTSADDKTNDEMLSIIRNDKDGFIFIFTFPGGGSSKTNTEIPQCGRGSGYETINDRFLVHVRLFSCDISESAIEYVRTLETLQEVAEAAITRAQSAANP
jgi:hypothetical protein